jgi:hypothetical protein
MTCLLCACPLDGLLCPHHPLAFDEDWAEGNRIWCGFFHRGHVPPRLPLAEREEGWADADVH